MSASSQVLTPRVLIQVLIFIVIVPFLPLLISGRWDWWEAWVYAAVAILSFIISRRLAARRHPDIIAERARILQHEDAKSWDKILAPLVGMGSGLVPLAAGLQARLSGLPSYSLAVRFAALAAILAGIALGSYALIENRFFSGMVRIQFERGHRVISSGPYHWVRHPGYAGGILVYLALPVFLETPWAFLPAGIIALVIILRTHLEDQALQQDLAGYREYTRQVRYRLLPGVW